MVQVEGRKKAQGLVTAPIFPVPFYTLTLPVGGDPTVSYCGVKTGIPGKLLTMARQHPTLAPLDGADYCILAGGSFVVMTFDEIPND